MLMITGEPLKTVFFGFLLLLNYLGLKVDISPSMQVTLHTILLVYIGSIDSTRLYKNMRGGKKDDKVEKMTQKDAWMFPVVGKFT